MFANYARAVKIARVLPAALLVVLASVLSPLAASAAVPADTARKASSGSVAMMAAAPTPSRIPKGSCRWVKFNWGVASSYVDDAFYGTMTVKFGTKTIAAHNAQRIMTNRWAYVLGRVCKPGTYTMIVRGDIMMDPAPNGPVRYDRILDRRSYVIR